MTFPAHFPPSETITSSRSFASKNPVVVELSKPDLRAQATSCDILDKAGAKKTGAMPKATQVATERKSTLLDELLAAAGFTIYVLGAIGAMAIGGPVGGAIYLGVTFLLACMLDDAQRSKIAAAHAAAQNDFAHQE